jgi:hypothetical protein
MILKSLATLKCWDFWYFPSWGVCGGDDFCLNLLIDKHGSVRDSLNLEGHPNFLCRFPVANGGGALE